MGMFHLVLPVLVFFSFLFPGLSLAAEVDWSRVKPSKLTLFYPGVASWDFLIGDDHRLGAREIKKGKKDCGHCHLGKDGELDLKTDEITAGTLKMKRSYKPFEPEPLPGRKGTLPVQVQAAYDREFLYVRFRWDSNGAGWDKKGKGSDRISIQVNKSEPSFLKYGCFIACHNDLSTMPFAPSKSEIEKHPAYKGRDEVRLYAFYARNSWAERKADADSRFRNGLIDLKSIRFSGGLAKAADGWVFDDRGWEDEPGFEGAGEWTDGKYAAVFKTRLGPAKKYNVGVSDGDVFSIGVAIHENGAVKRKHYVSFPFAIGLGSGRGDIQAVEVRN